MKEQILELLESIRPDVDFQKEQHLIDDEILESFDVIQIVTTLRQNALAGYVSKESPVGQALLGRKAGERVLVQVNPQLSYYAVIQAVEKGQDNDALPISTY